MLRRIRRAQTFRAIVSGMTLGLARSLNLLGLVLLVAWTYSRWGSERSPLAVLLWPALILIALSWLLRLTSRAWMPWMKRATRAITRRREVQEQVRLSRGEIRKL